MGIQFGQDEKKLRMTADELMKKVGDITGWKLLCDVLLGIVAGGFMMAQPASIFDILAIYLGAVPDN